MSKRNSIHQLPAQKMRIEVLYTSAWRVAIPLSVSLWIKKRYYLPNGEIKGK
jgi:hypothetical protein